MNMHEGGPPGEEFANWKAPDEEGTEDSQENMEFKPFEAPEVPDDGDEYKSEQPEAGEAVKHIIKDGEGNKIYHRETSPTSDWQKKMSHDEQGRLASMEIQKLTPGKESHTFDQFEYDEKTGEATKTGEIKSGLDAGHKYEEQPITEEDLGDGKVIKTITTKIIEKGPNGSGEKPHENGTILTKKVYMENGKWLGEKQTGDDNSESTNFPDGIEEIPNWQ